MFDPKFVFIRDQEKSKEYLTAGGAVRAGADKVYGPHRTYRVHLEGNVGIDRPEFKGARARAIDLVRDKPTGTVVYFDALKQGILVDRVKFRKTEGFPPEADTRGPIGLDRVEGFIRAAFPDARFAGDCVCKPLDHGDCAAVDYFDTVEEMTQMRDALMGQPSYFRIKYIILFDRIYFFNEDGSFDGGYSYTGQYHSHIHVSVYDGISRSAC